MATENNELMCPRCGDTNLHHDEVTVFERPEDSVTGLRVRVSGVDGKESNQRPASVSIDTTMTGNPSARRQGLSVALWCESCGGRSKLTIVQHKGVTYLEHYDVKVGGST